MLRRIKGAKRRTKGEVKSKDVFLEGSRDTDLIIAIIGPIGSGKSTFINTLIGQDVMSVGHEMQAETVEVQYFTWLNTEFPDNRIVVLDTPGFDTVLIDEWEILRRVAAWLIRSDYNSDTKLAGVIYLRDITQNRIPAVTMNFDVFDELCGREGTSKVMLATTMWSEVPKEVGQQRENGLRADYWKHMLDHGSTMTRFDGTQRSARDIVNYILGRNALNAVQILQPSLCPSAPAPDTMAAVEPPGPKIELVAAVEVLFADREQYKQLLACRNSSAQGLLDMFQRLLDVLDMPPSSSFRRDLIVATQRLAGASGLYPACYELNHVTTNGDYSESSGGFADIYKGSFQGRVVCLKTIRLNRKTEMQYFLKACSKEAILWGQLSHPNIIPFYGIYRFGNRISLVSPWMEHGDINNYLQSHACADRVLLVSDVAQGLRFLHVNGIIHGDLKGPNILVDEFGRACVADFGISSISAPHILVWTSHSAVASKGGSVRWQAPELFDPDNEEEVHNTVASDVYAWSCVAYEIFAGHIPFVHLSRDTAILLKVSKGERPIRPSDSSPSWSAWGLTEKTWSLMQDCWKADPMERPTVDHIIQQLMPRLSQNMRVAEQKSAISPARFREMARIGLNHDELSIQTLERLLNSPSTD